MYEELLTLLEFALEGDLNITIDEALCLIELEDFWGDYKHDFDTN